MTTRVMVETWSHQTSSWDVIADESAPGIILLIPEYKLGFFGMKERGAKLRFIFNVTKENLAQCEQIATNLGQVRHIGKRIANVGIGEKDYLATNPVLEKERRLVHIIVSSDKEAVDGQHLLFETLWKSAMPLRLRIRELEAVRR
jgi:hypothetical protein